MTSNESWRKYLEAGAAVGQATAARAEDIARRLFEGDDEERDDAWRDLEQLTRFGRLMGEQLAEMAKTELSRQLRSVGGRSLDQIFDRIADLLGAPESPESSEPASTETDESVLEARVVVVAEPPTTPEAEMHRGKKDKKAKKASAEKRKKKDKKKDKGKARRTHPSEDGAKAGSGPIRMVVPPPESAGGS